MSSSLSRRTAWSALALGALFACTREAEIADDPVDGIGMTPTTPLDDGTRIDLGAGFGSDAFPACETRAEGDCRGVNDFPCDFPRWVEETGVECQNATGCVTNGWLEVHMNADGCVESASMSEPNDAFRECVIEAFGSLRCPCGEDTISTFLGIGNHGCHEGPSACGTGEFPCGPDEECVAGLCQPTGTP